MECVEARRALKSSLQSETFMIQQAAASSLDDVNSDEFSVDDLLDLSDKDFAEDFASQDNDNDSISSSSSIYSAQFSTSGDLLSLTAQHLTVPVIIITTIIILHVRKDGLVRPTWFRLELDSFWVNTWPTLVLS